jgi:hypothetical protein
MGRKVEVRWSSATVRLSESPSDLDLRTWTSAPSDWTFALRIVVPSHRD